MGKRRVQQRQVRRQVRQVKPKLPAQPVTDKQQKRQRERYVAAGGMLQGYAPELVLRVGYVSAARLGRCRRWFMPALNCPAAQSRRSFRLRLWSAAAQA